MAGRTVYQGHTQQAVHKATKGPKCLTTAPAFSRLSLSLRKPQFLT